MKDIKKMKNFFYCVLGLEKIRTRNVKKLNNFGKLVSIRSLCVCVLVEIKIFYIQEKQKVVSSYVCHRNESVLHEYE
jgi:hypothetical protein